MSEWTYSVVWQDTSDWLVWCSSCHHGGHYSHITKWFETHSECPVNGCNCHCSEISRVYSNKQMNTHFRSTLKQPDVKLALNDYKRRVSKANVQHVSPIHNSPIQF